MLEYAGDSDGRLGGSARTPRVTYTQAVVLGVVQGITEFLPISSSGHLILVPRFFGWPDQGLAFDAVMHLGTLAALLAYFRAELYGFLSGALSRRLALLLVVATVPGGLAGLALGTLVETRLRSPLVIALATAGWAVVMWVADRRARPAPPAGEALEQVRWSQGLGVGVAQALALIPGTSRSGVTITAGLLTGLDRATAARYAFLLGIPITAAAGGLKMLQLVRTGVPADDAGPLVAAVLAAFLSGWGAVWFLVTYLRRRPLTPFIVYRLALATAIVLALGGSQPGVSR
jgi:undecaprenyl-diphosphatase